MSERVRVDKWLWHARFFKTRALARSAVLSGTLRHNGHRLEKPACEVKSGDILTIPRGRDVLVVQVLACGIRRGPAREAQGLYAILPETALDPAQRAS